MVTVNEKTFNTKKEACEHFKFKYVNVIKMLCVKRKTNKNFTFEDTINHLLNIKKKIRKLPHGCKTLRELEKMYHLSKDSLTRYMSKYHVNVKKALYSLANKPKIFYNGMFFKTKKDLAEYLGIEQYTFYTLMNKYKNFSFRKAIKIIISKKRKNCIYKNKIYKNKKIMCKSLNISYNQFKYYFYKKKFTLEKSIEICIQKQK